MKLFSGSQMQQLDRQAIEQIGLPSLVLMENAGRAVAQALFRRVPDLSHKHVVVVAGKGNNGGDGIVVARALAEHGVSVEVLWLAQVKHCSQETKTQHDVLAHCGAPLSIIPDATALRRMSAPLKRADVVVDALLGVGVQGSVRGYYAKAIETVNRAGWAKKLAVDVPSGLDANTGWADGVCVRADWTVTLGAPKTGLLFHPGRSYVGALEVVPIGYPPSLIAGFDSGLVWVDRDEVAQRLPQRRSYSHKGSYGRALVIGGACGLSGAVTLCVQGALRSGAGVVHAAFPASLDTALAVQVPEAVKHPMPETQGALASSALQPLLALVNEMQAVALGPGMSMQAQTLVRALIKGIGRPLIVDADGLNALCGHLKLLKQRPASTVLTPHPGEFARMIGHPVDDIERNRLALARAFAQRHNVILVLKGVPTVVAVPKGNAYVINAGNSGLAKGGSGDVLAGILVALVAQGAAPEAAACCAAWVHGRAAEVLKGSHAERSMLPRDVLDALPSVFAAFEQTA